MSSAFWKATGSTNSLPELVACRSFFRLNFRFHIALTVITFSVKKCRHSCLTFFTSFTSVFSPYFFLRSEKCFAIATLVIEDSCVSGSNP